MDPVARIASSGHQFDGQGREFVVVEGIQDGYVEQAVRTVCIRGYSSIVAPLVGIGDSDKYGLLGPFLSVNVDRELFGTVVVPQPEGFLHVGQDSAPACLGECLADIRIKAYTADGEERVAIDETGIKRDGLSGSYHIHCFDDIVRDVQKTGKSVTAPARDDAKNLACPENASADFIQGSVPSDCHYNILGGLSGKFLTLSGPGGDDIFKAHFIKP